MKKLLYCISVLLMAVSCSDDGDSSTDPSSAPVPLQTSIADGTSDVPVSTTQIVLTYDQKTWRPSRSTTRPSTLQT